MKYPDLMMFWKQKILAQLLYFSSVLVVFMFLFSFPLSSIAGPSYIVRCNLDHPPVQLSLSEDPRSFLECLQVEEWYYLVLNKEIDLSIANEHYVLMKQKPYMPFKTCGEALENWKIESHFLFKDPISSLTFFINLSEHLVTIGGGNTKICKGSRQNLQ